MLITISIGYLALSVFTVPSALPIYLSELLSTLFLDYVSINFSGFIVIKMSTGGVCCL